MKASVKTFIDLHEKPVVVLGDMGELGDNEKLYHQQFGEYLGQLNKNVKYLTVGNLAKEIGKALESQGLNVNYFESNEDVSSYTIFLKASRAMKFEEILEYVKRGICKL